MVGGIANNSCLLLELICIAFLKERDRKSVV